MQNIYGFLCFCLLFGVFRVFCFGAIVGFQGLGLFGFLCRGAWLTASGKIKGQGLGLSSFGSTVMGLGFRV